MKKNLGTIDRIARIAIAIIIAALYFSKIISGTSGIVLLSVGGIFIITGFISFCPVYFLFGLSTAGKKMKAES